MDIQDSEDPEGLRVFYYLVQDLKASAFVHLDPTCSAAEGDTVVPHLFSDFPPLQNKAYLDER